MWLPFPGLETGLGTALISASSQFQTSLFLETLTAVLLGSSWRVNLAELVVSGVVQTLQLVIWAMKNAVYLWSSTNKL